jgi:hypothetical protein
MAAIKRIEKLIDTLSELPEQHIREVEDFAEFLRAKTQRERPGKRTRNIVKLEGRWKDTPFEITNEDVREVRQKLGQRIATSARKAH